MSSTRAEDLAARFEAKREECEQPKNAALREARSIDRAYWNGRLSAFAEARDMARAGAAGGAGLRAAAVRLLGYYGSTSPESEAAWDALERAVRATPVAPPPPAQQGEKQRRDEDGFVCEYDPGCKPETDTYTICWDGGARWLIVDRHGLITAGQSPADDRPVQQTTWQALMSPPPAQQGSSSPPLTAERVDLGELERLSEVATLGEWGIWPEPIHDRSEAIRELTEQVEKTDPISGYLYLLNAEGKCPATTGCGPTSEANAAFICALVNAYRSGKLIEAPAPDPERHCPDPAAMIEQIGKLFDAARAGAAPPPPAQRGPSSPPGSDET